MAISVVMPALEMAQDTGKLVSWRKKEGESVTKGEILLEVETDKAVVEIEALADGILGGVKAQPGDVIPVGQTIAWLLDPGESAPAEQASAQAAVAAAARPSSAPAAPAAQTSAESARTESKRVKISPKARRLAQERGIDVNRLQGSGADGEILASDILAAAEAAGAAAASAPSAASAASSTGTAPVTQVLSSIGRLMAERTTQSWTTVPHFFVIREVDGTKLNEARAKFGPGIESSRGVRLTHTDLLISHVARALEQHPRLNASWTGQGIRLNEEINIGLAMAVEDGVVTGVIRNANALELADIAVQRRDLAERARANKLRPTDINGATFTISNLGMYHVNSFTAIIVPPQAAILAVGEIADRVVALNGQPAVRPMLTMTISSDHRVVDGARAAAFMQTLATAIQ